MYRISEAKGKFDEIGIGWLIDYNPLAQLIELSRFMLIGEGQVYAPSIGFAILTSIIILIFGTLIFNKTEKSFTDTI